MVLEPQSPSSSRSRSTTPSPATYSAKLLAAASLPEQKAVSSCAHPNAQGIYQSGNSDHKERWTKSSANRHDTNRPAHVVSAFFLQRDHQRRMLDGDGDLIITPCDHQFGDNVGFYRVNFLLRRGTRPPTQID